MNKIRSILKQEMVFIPLMFVVIELFRFIILKISPETALFDRGSEFETFLVSIWKLVWATSAVWVLLRIVFPSVYDAMKAFYTGFATLPDEKKRAYSIRI